MRRTRWSVYTSLFCAVSFHGMNGPYTSSRQAAQVRANVFNSVRPSQAISTEEYYPADELEARNIHAGWPTLSALPGRPWDIMNHDTKASTTGNWVSRRMVIHRYTVSLRSEDLEPSKVFVKEVEDALEQPSFAERMQALRRTCGVWGEMMPLDVVIGASLAATGTLAPNQNLTGSPATFRPDNRGPDVMQTIDKCLDITNHFDKRLESRVQGGYPEVFSKSGFDEWLTNTLNIDNSSTWEIVKVNRAAPITDLLPQALRQKVQRLCSSVLSRSVCVGYQVQLNFDGALQGIKDIKQITVWSDVVTVRDLSITYVDGTVRGPYGYGKTNQSYDSFLLSRDETITKVFAWATQGDVVALQFAKNTGQVSNIYGPQPVTVENPHVLNGGGDALLGLSGTFNSTHITQIQPVWRGDVTEEQHRHTAVTHTGFYSINNLGTTFNDYGYLGNPYTARISQIRFRNVTNAYLAGFQVVYSFERAGRSLDQETPIRGVPSGLQETWTLGKDEFIKEVRVKRSSSGIAMLEFVTDKGTIKRMGQDVAEEVVMKPPHKDMVLYYIIGRSHTVLQWMSFVWGMPPA
ncbi:unnamed protein product [Rhizoctonia solani]|uniref:Jacalin-type lectin domain-containing protein n=1 Tax=Rhizoctonia solani TaxID=456999 RepID=A0A8H3D0C3_9AGAM|nr:unnamed protein product [Rhizoctonia solani]